MSEGDADTNAEDALDAALTAGGRGFTKKTISSGRTEHSLFPNPLEAFLKTRE